MEQFGVGSFGGVQVIVRCYRGFDYKHLAVTGAGTLCGSAGLGGLALQEPGFQLGG